jgi:hypothetical protein
LNNADAVVGVVEPTPRGLLRYLDWFSDAGLLRADVLTVLNKVPSSRRVAFEARQQLVDIGADLIGDVCEAPHDRAVAAAEWDGRLITRGRFRKALVAIADELDRRLLVDEAVTV